MAGSSSDTRLNFDTKQVDIPSAGTRVRILRVVNGATLTIRAHTGNTGDVYVGDEKVSSTNGFILGPGESIEIIHRPDKSRNVFYDIHVDVATSGDDISYIYFE